MKMPVVRQVNSLCVGCDKVGNVLLVKFSYRDARDSAILINAADVFWLLDNIPLNQDPALQPPSAPAPELTKTDWDDRITPRVFSVQGKQLGSTARMTFELNQKPDLTLVFDAASLELLRRRLELYREDLTKPTP